MVRNPSANAGDVGDVGSLPGSGRSPGGGHGNPLQYSCLENAMNRGAWWASVHRVAKNRTQLKRLRMQHALGLKESKLDGAEVIQSLLLTSPWPVNWHLFLNQEDASITKGQKHKLMIHWRGPATNQGTWNACRSLNLWDLQPRKCGLQTLPHKPAHSRIN